MTRDGRHLCLKHLKAAIARETPMVGCYRGLTRTDGHKQATGEPGPWHENAVRALSTAEAATAPAISERTVRRGDGEVPELRAKSHGR